MKEEVHILATVRKPELVDAATLVFQTLRTGFPSANVTVHMNSLFGMEAVCRAAGSVGAYMQGGERMVKWDHWKWIQHLLHEMPRPFWICDTDVVFFKSVEGWFERESGLDFAGRYEPEFLDPCTGTRHVERLHTCLMWINPPVLKAKLASWQGQYWPSLFGNADAPMIAWNFIPVRGGRALFYDTMAGCWQAGMGQEFTSEQDAAFEHLHCATYADLAGRAPELRGLPSVHQSIYKDPSLARGLHAQQQKFYQKQGEALSEAGKHGDTLVIEEK